MFARARCGGSLWTAKCERGLNLGALMGIRRSPWGRLRALTPYWYYSQAWGHETAIFLPQFPRTIWLTGPKVWKSRVGFSYLVCLESGCLTHGGEAHQGLAMAIRGSAFVLFGLLLSGCMQATLEPASEANFTPRDKKHLANVPYAQATIPHAYQRHIVHSPRAEQPASVRVDTDARDF